MKSVIQLTTSVITVKSVIQLTTSVMTMKSNSVYDFGNDSEECNSVNDSVMTVKSVIQLTTSVMTVIIYHDFLPTPSRGSHVKSDKAHAQSSGYTP